MIRTIPLPAGTTFTWIDLLDPTPDEVQAVGREHGIPAEVVRDFLKQPHLPKIEQFPEGLLVIVRAYDEEARSGDTYQALTRRVVAFLKKDVFVTLRRKDQPFAALVVEKATAAGALPPAMEDLLRWLIGGAVHTYQEPLRLAEEELDHVECALLEGQRAQRGFRRSYQIKRRCAVIKRVLSRSLTLLRELSERHADPGGYLSDLREEADRLQAWAEELLEGATHLMHLQLSLEGQRTNEVMRVLTVFSAFFLPLTFIAGVYGMNFKHMPELDQRYGYYATWAGMALLTLGIFMWFRNKGWLK